MFKFTKISDVGTSHPVIARLQIQTTELLKFSNLSQEKKDEIFGIILESMHKRLLKCHKIKDNIYQKTLSTIKDTENKPDQDPYIIDINTDAENFLYEGKNFLRDLAEIFNIFYSTDFDGASNFICFTDNKKGKIPLWIEAKYGENDNLSAVLKEDQFWIKELIQKRNAVEHPKGINGQLIIENIKRINLKEFQGPIWYREKNKKLKTAGEKANILQDMDVLCNNLLTFAEDIIALSIKKTFNFPEMIDIQLIPEEERSPDVPMRLRIGATEKFTKIINKADKKK